MAFDKRDLWTLGGLGLLGLVIWKSQEVTAAVTVGAGYVVNVFERGDKLTDTTPDANGVIQDNPADLADQAAAVLGVASTVDTYSLARMGRSEGVDGMEVRMHIALNDLADLQRQYGGGVYSSVTALMTHSKQSDADGLYGKQYRGHRYSTAHDPYTGDYNLAQKVQTDHADGFDPSGGALKFVDKSGFASQEGATRTYDDVVAAWAKQGLQPFNVDGASDNFVVFRKVA